MRKESRFCGMSVSEKWLSFYMCSRKSRRAEGARGFHLLAMAKTSAPQSSPITPAIFRELKETPPFKCLRIFCGVFSLFAAYFKGSTLLFTNFCEKRSQKFRDLEGAALCARPLRALLYRCRAHSPFKRSRANWVVLRKSVIFLARVIMPQIHPFPVSRSVGKQGCAAG